MNTRLRTLQSSLARPILIKKKENLFYLTGRSFDYRAEEYLLVTKKDVVGFGSGLEQIDWVKKSDRLKNIGQYIKSKKLDIEWGFTFGEAKYLRYKIKDSGFKIKIQPARSPVDVMRQFKTQKELVLIRTNMRMVEKVFEKVKRKLRKEGAKGRFTERALAEFIKKEGFALGAEDVAFPPIVASGVNAAIPHHVPSSKKLKPGESIIIDFGFSAKGGSAFGGKLPGYCSDFTRTVFLKRVPSRLEKAYIQVEKAYLESIRFIESPFPNPSRQGRGIRRFPPRGWREGKGGVIAGDVYQKAVDVLAEAKLDKYFIHSLGHGTGLEIHELPNLSPGSKDVLKDNMVFSIEPGVYIKGLGGIRIEDLVYLEQGKVQKSISVPTLLKNNILI